MPISDREQQLCDLIEYEFGVRITTRESIFQSTGWWWQGSTDIICEKCKNSFDVYRRPFEAAGMQHQYWAIACVTCSKLSTLDELPTAIKKSIKAEYYLPPVPISAGTPVVNNFKTQEKTQVHFEITGEQQKAIDCVRLHRRLGIQALAGTGKTTTLKLIAEKHDSKRIQYIAFNKAIVEDVKSKMPNNVACNTAHSLAFRAVGHPYAARLNAQSLKDYRQIASALDVERFSFRQDNWIGTFTAAQMAQMANLAVGAFVKSVDTDVMLSHIEPRIHMIVNEEDVRQEIAEQVLPIARAIWADLCQTSGLFKFEHDHYLKMWQLRHPRIDKDIILFDEAQDADPVMIDIVSHQPHAQIVFCGDSFQQIYEWRGAKDAMKSMTLDHETWLTKSFRFGDAIASEANEILAQLSQSVRVQGLSEIKSTCSPDIRPNVVLCRTNAGLMENISHYLMLGYKVATTVERAMLIVFFRECIRLQQFQEVTHPELSAFQSWAELEEWTTTYPAEAGELASMVRLVNRIGADRLITALEQCTDEADANIVVTTAHRAKGREWNNVRIHSDFPHIDDMEEEDLRLIYVAMTRAKLNLDLSAWETVEPNPNKEFLRLITTHSPPLPRMQQIPREKPRRRDV